VWLIGLNPITFSKQTMPKLTAADYKGLTILAFWSALYPYIRSLTVKDSSGEGNGTEAYYSNADLTKGGSYKFAALFFHGATRDSFSYFCSGVATMPYSQDNGNWAEDEILIISPTFAYKSDWLVQQGYESLYWSHSMDYRTGARSSTKFPDGSSNPHPVSSFEVIDSIMVMLNNTKLFPNMKMVSLVGHSAGGQTVQRYALSSKIQPANSPLTTDAHPRISIDKTVRFVVANPSSFTYLDNRRWQYKCDNDTQTCTTGSLAVPSESNYRFITQEDENPPKFFVDTCDICAADGKGGSQPYYKSHNASADFFCWDPKYNDWAYGMDNIATMDEYHHYFEDGWNQTLQLQQYAFRDVWYLSGVLDQCSPAMEWYNTSGANNQAVVNLGDFDDACDYHKVDTRCPAMLQGPWREYRATHYMAYLAEYYAPDTHMLVEWITSQSFNLVPGVGHDGTGMLTSSAGTAAIYTRYSQAAVETDDLGWRRSASDTVKEKLAKISAMGKDAA